MKVSVVIAVYNGEATIAAAVESALAQKFDGEFEVIVVNDGSTDGTAEVLRGYGDRIKVVAQENRGLSAARNAGVQNSTGKYLAFLDADDEWTAEKLAKTVAALEERPDAVLAYTDASQIDARGLEVSARFVPRDRARAPTLNDLLSGLWGMLPSATVIRADTLAACGGFSQEFGLGFAGEDIWTWLVARQSGPFLYLDESLTRYRVPTLESLRQHANGAALSSAIASWRSVENRIHGYEVLHRLLYGRYGRRAAGLLDDYRRWTAGCLLTYALLAMHDGDHMLARKCYLAALRIRPFQPKSVIRLLWTFVSPRASAKLCNFMPARVARALTGPPTM